MDLSRFGWRRVLAICVAVVGLTALVVLGFRRFSSSEPARIIDPTLVSEPRTYDLQPSVDDGGERFASAIEQEIRQAIDGLIRSGDPAPPVGRQLARMAATELRIQVTGSLEDLLSHIESNPGIAPLPERLRNNPDSLRRIWEKKAGTLRAAPVDTSAVTIRPRKVNKESYEYNERSRVTAERPGRIIGLPRNPEGGTRDIWEVVIPIEIRGYQDKQLKTAVTFPGRVGLWMVNGPQPHDWNLYKITIYDVPQGIHVLMPTH